MLRAPRGNSTSSDRRPMPITKMATRTSVSVTAGRTVWNPRVRIALLWRCFSQPAEYIGVRLLAEEKWIRISGSIFPVLVRCFLDRVHSDEAVLCVDSHDKLFATEKVCVWLILRHIAKPQVDRFRRVLYRSRAYSAQHARGLKNDLGKWR